MAECAHAFPSYVACPRLLLQEKIRTNLLMFFDSRSEKQEIAGQSRLAFMSNDCTDIVGHDVSHRPDDPDTPINIDSGRRYFH